jgi:Ser/Thr protein kinase RdoA (MazF antagonist)
MATVDSSLAYQDLQPDAILAAVESLGLQCDGRLLALNSYENRVYRVGIEDDAPVVAKFYRPARWSDEAIREEHQFAAELAADEIPVVAPFEYGGETLHHREAFRFAVYPCHGGHSPELDRFDLLRQLGRLVARIHRRGATSKFSARPRIDLATYGRASQKYLLEYEFIPADLQPAYVSTCDDLFERIARSFEFAGNPAYIRVHGDFHPGNVLVLEDRVHIVDLDDARMGPTIQDLWMLLSGDREEQTPQLHELLDGYLEFNDFDARELHLLEALRTLRIMHYAGWLAQRWEDPAFRIAFPWFNSHRYWDEHVLALREQAALMDEPPIAWQR